MQRGRNARLDRLTRRAGTEDSAAAERYHLLSARAAIGQAVRWSLACRGIDPSRAVALRLADEAAAELAVLGSPPPLAPADPPGRGGDPASDPVARFGDRMGRLAAQYRDRGEVPDLAQASLAELLAWCIAHPEEAGTGST